MGASAILKVQGTQRHKALFETLRMLILENLCGYWFEIEGRDVLFVVSHGRRNGQHPILNSTGAKMIEYHMIWDRQDGIVVSHSFHDRPIPAVLLSVEDDLLQVTR